MKYISLFRTINDLRRMSKRLNENMTNKNVIILIAMWPIWTAAVFSAEFIFIVFFSFSPREMDPSAKQRPHSSYLYHAGVFVNIL